MHEIPCMGRGLSVYRPNIAFDFHTGFGRGSGEPEGFLGLTRLPGALPGIASRPSGDVRGLLSLLGRHGATLGILWGL